MLIKEKHRITPARRATAYDLDTPMLIPDISISKQITSKNFRIATRTPGSKLGSCSEDDVWLLSSASGSGQVCSYVACYAFRRYLLGFAAGWKVRSALGYVPTLTPECWERHLPSQKGCELNPSGDFMVTQQWLDNRVRI